MYNYIVDDDFKITYFDSDLAAYSPRLCIGDTCYRAFCQRDEPCLECAAAQQAGGETSWYQYNDAFDRWVRVQRCPMTWDPSGNTLIRTEVVDHEMVDECERTIQVFEGQTVLAGGSGMHVPIMPRNIFLKEAGRFIADHDDEAWCMVSIDILNFKLYNEWFGSDSGDELLRTVARYLLDLQELKGVPAGYLGQDDFAVILPDDEDFITETHKHIARLTARDDRCSVFAPSFGVFRIEDASHEPNTWLSMAQLAGEEVHTNRSRLVRWFDPSLYQATEASQHLLSDVRRALAEHEFTFYLQPQCRLDTGKVVGFEALARWDHPTHGIIPPLRYVGMLERCGLIRELDLYIWEAVCAQLAAWNAEGIRTLPISINVSTLDLYEIDVPATLSELCERYEIDPSLIVIEITESVYVENFDKIAEVTTQLHAAGFRVAMDDFGSGYSSLAMLKNIDVDSVKVDMQFLRLDKSNIERGTNILAFIIRLVNVLKIDILAEGVEEDYQVDLLLSMGCRLAQGFHYYRPMTIANAHNLLLRDDLVAQADDIESDYGRFGISDLVGKGIISDRLLEKLLGPTAICEVGPDGLKVLNVNPEGLGLLHLDPQEVRLEQESIINHFLGGDLGMLSAAFEDAYQNRPHRTRITLKGTRRSGSDLWLAVRICFLQERGDWRMFCLAMNDVTPIDPRHLQGSSPAVRVAQTLEGADPADQILLDLVHIISTGEYGRAFDRFLERMGKHYGATRCYIFELDRDAGTCSNTYEWCDEGVSAEIGNLQNLPIELVADWIAAFESVGEFYISSIAGDDDPDSPTNRILAAQGIDSLITAPLRENGRIIGFVGVDDPTRNVHDFSALRVAAEFVSECNKMSTLTTRSYIDPLTGLGNRRANMRMIDLVDTGQPSSMGIAFVDLNGLKRINDAAGHRAGDAALVHMADALCDIAGRDNVYRFGGDEFIVALPGCTRERYDEVVARLREDLGPVSSMGCTWQEFCTNPLPLVEKADALMYEEKRRFYESLQNAVE